MIAVIVQLPIYEMKVVVIIDDWQEANKKFKIGIDEEEIEAGSIEGYAEISEDKSTIYLLFRNEYLTYNTISHEIFHAVTFICKATGTKVDVDNDEPLAYLNGHLSEKIFEAVDNFICIGKKKKKK